LTHEVENSGDGTASQQSEVQTVTFNAGRGLGGTATLTYNDLYGQSWTTRPFNVGGDNVYRLEVSIKNGENCNTATNECTLTFTFGSGNTADAIISNVNPTVASDYLTEQALRGALLSLFPGVYEDRGNTIYVHKHNSLTAVKLGGAIEAATRISFDIHIPMYMSGHDDNGGITELSAAWKATTLGGSGLAANTREFKLYQLGDRSTEIESALTSLPNQVIPSVTVNKVDVTDTDTNSNGAYGNAYAQSYAITFNNEANSGDQNMLTCNAGPCDESGCINRGPGVSEVRYMHHDPESYGQGINFVNQGYFIMDIGTNAVVAPATLSAGTIRIMWDTGAGISSAEFAVVASAAEVQTALRTITGWEGVTVELWGNYGRGLTLTTNHQFKVKFAAGYDDLGKSPTFKTLGTADGAYATPVPTGIEGRLYDQRFSNSIWLGKVTGYVEVVVGSNAGALKFTPLSATTALSVHAMPEVGDIWAVSHQNFGVGNGAGTPVGTPPTASGTYGTDYPYQMVNKLDANDADAIAKTSFADGANFAYLYEGRTSVQTSDYFAVGSTIEVLDTTWSDAAPQTPIIGNAYKSNNLYRKFKVTGHVTSQFNREFAKLDSFPADDNVVEPPVAGSSDAGNIAARPKYNLKITSNNGTVHTYENRDVSTVAGSGDGLNVQVTVNEIQVVILGTGIASQNSNQVWKLYYKGEESQNMDWQSTPAQVAEEINGFSGLSGHVSVAGEAAATTDTTGFPKYVVTFAAHDGDVAEMTAVTTAGVVTVVTRANGWSIESPIDFGIGRLDTMQAGGIVNVTAKEVCTFTETGGTGTVGYYCYDGVCGPASADGTGNEAQVALRLIKDDNGDAILGTAAIAETTATDPKTVTMPLGKSCDGLELRGTTNAITKSVDKHNNGKQFKITRSFLKSAVVTGTGYDGTTEAATTGVGKLILAAGEGDQLLPEVDSLVIKGCTTLGVAATDAGRVPFSRVTESASATGGTTATLLQFGDMKDSNTLTNCVFSLGRHVITLDSMPTASPVATKKHLHYTSPVGSCSVSETAKGTYESYECSNRGACDGKSGLCTCYEGYSGQSCQTQTVLV